MQRALSIRMTVLPAKSLSKRHRCYNSNRKQSTPPVDDPVVVWSARATKQSVAEQPRFQRALSIRAKAVPANFLFGVPGPRHSRKSRHDRTRSSERCVTQRQRIREGLTVRRSDTEIAVDDQWSKHDRLLGRSQLRKPRCNRKMEIHFSTAFRTKYKATPSQFLSELAKILKQSVHKRVRPSQRYVDRTKSISGGLSAPGSSRDDSQKIK